MAITSKFNNTFQVTIDNCTTTTLGTLNLWPSQVVVVQRFLFFVIKIEGGTPCRQVVVSLGKTVHNFSNKPECTDIIF